MISGAASLLLRVTVVLALARQKANPRSTSSRLVIVATRAAFRGLGGAATLAGAMVNNFQKPAADERRRLKKLSTGESTAKPSSHSSQRSARE